jgi:hypothetical protein
MKIWAAVLVLMFLFGLVWAVFPVISGQSLAGDGRPVVLEPIPTPAFLEGVFGEEMSPLLVSGVLAGLVVVLIGGGGAVLAGINAFIARLVTNTKDSSDYKEKQAALEKKEKETLKALQEGRKSPGMPEHTRNGWSAVSTSLIYILFAASLGLIVSRTFFPEVFIEQEDGLFSPGPLIAGALSLVALIAGYIWMRPKNIAQIDTTDHDPIPWDRVAVIVTGLLIVGLGLAAAVYLNQPA